MVDQVDHRALARGEQRVDRSDEVVGRVDGDVLHGLVHLAVNHARDYLGLAHGELESFAAHRLDQDRELQFATTLDLPGVGTIGGQYAQRDVADEFFVEAVLHHARGEELALGARQRGGVDANGHREARLVDVQWLKGWGFSASARVSPMVMSSKPATATMSPGPALWAGIRSKGFGDKELRYLGVLDGAVDATPRDALAALEVVR